jgi:hypothetical protein
VTTTAKVMSSQPSEYDERDRYIAFTFLDEAGTPHKAKRTLKRPESPPSPNDEVEIIYLRGSPEKARLVVERSWTWPIIALGMIVIAVVWSILTYRRMEAGKF